MLNKMPDLIISIFKKDTDYISKNLYKAYIISKFIANPNYSAAETYYTKYRNYILSDLYGPILKTAY